MKKKLYFLSMLAAGLTLAGCNDDLGDGPGNEVQSGDKGYVKIAINLPTTSGQVTRAAADGTDENDKFDDGLESEYAVNDVCLLLFKGANENVATYVGGYDLNLAFNTEDPINDNVTSKAAVVQEIINPKLAAEESLYALAVVNPNSVVDYTSTAGTLYVSGSSVTDLAGLKNKISNINSDLGLFIGSSSTPSFTMTNAPLATLPANNVGGLSDLDVTTLVPLTIYDSSEKASLGKADDIYVERVVAKVTVANTNFTEDEGKFYMTVTDNSGNYSGDQVYMDGWYLNVTNRSTKLVRDVTDWETWKEYSNPENASTTINRFFGMQEPYRVYWAVDGNYNNWSSDQTSEFNYYTENSGEPTTAQIGSSNPLYCLENTFDVAHMQQGETTGIVFKMTYNFAPDRPAGTFYMIGTDVNIYDMDDETTDNGVDNNFITKVNTLLDDKAITDLDVNSSAKGGYYDTQAKMKDLFKTTAGSISDEQALDLLNALGEVKVYENGATYYYAARIKHFGDYYTPLPANANESTWETSDYVPADHLGRYGVVRNNWYEIVISSISGPGMPEKPEPEPEDPDDKDYAYVNCRINILSWAKREQNVDL